MVDGEGAYWKCGCLARTGMAPRCGPQARAARSYEKPPRGTAPSRDSGTPCRRGTPIRKARRTVPLPHPIRQSDNPTIRQSHNAPIPRGAGFHLAHVLSYVINPLILPPIAFSIILRHFGAPAGEIAGVAAVALVFFTLVPLWYIARMVRAGEAESLEVRRREDRWRPLLFGVGSYAVGVALLMVVGETALLLLVVLALLYPVNTLVVALITRRWKISVHMVGLASFISILLFGALLVSDALPPREGSLLRAATVLPLLVLVPLLMWARVRVEAHTLGQVAGGAAFGLVVPYAQLELIVGVMGLV